MAFSYTNERPPTVLLTAVFALGSLFIGGLAVGRLLYEALFPQASWLGRPLPALLLAAGVAVVAIALFRPKLSTPQTALALAPLLFNLAYLFNATVALIGSRLLFLAALWLVVLFLAQDSGRLSRWPWLPFVFIIAFLLPVYLLTLGRTVGTADTFEFQVVVPKLGIVHPTGYPLYLLLTRLFTFIPLYSVAWRANLATAVYAVAAACLLYQFLQSLTGRRLIPILAAVLFGLSPTFWSQSIQAEVYTLHALIVAALLLLMRRIGRWQLVPDTSHPSPPSNLPFLLAFLLGLGLTNHLTTLILVPPAVFTLLYSFVARFGKSRIDLPNRATKIASTNGKNLKFLLLLIIAFLAPLLLYLYLPLRWQAVNGEPMGLARFIDWVVGGRFQDALQLTAWLNDATRYAVVGRLFTSEWLPIHLLLALGGLFVLAWRVWPAALALALTWLGFAFYALNYYVPDLSVFIIPAHLVIAIFWSIGCAAIIQRLENGKRFTRLAIYPLLSLLMLFVFQQAAVTWIEVDASPNDGQTAWGRAVLEQPIDPQAAILADSSKFPALYYLQQAEGFRPQMDITLLPDEAAYRAELDNRLAAAQTVYLARFLPGLAGIYHLRSAGPLTEVSLRPLTSMPDTAESSDLIFGSIRLTGYQLQTLSPYNPAETAVTFYWQTAEPVERVQLVYIRWSGDGYAGPVSSQHPANNNYPTNAWRPGEIVVDFHTHPRPILNRPGELALQIALAPPFTPPAELAWQTVTTTTFEPPTSLAEANALRMQVGPLSLQSISFPDQVRPESEIQIQFQGFGQNPELLVLQLQPTGSYSPVPFTSPMSSSRVEQPFIWSTEITANVPAGRYYLVAAYPGQPATCSWLAAPKVGCIVAEIEVSGVPLPEDAANFNDQIALLAIEVPDGALQPGGQLAVRLTWQALSRLPENYTVFVQVVDEQDRIVGQVDSWPLQGTFPTSQWTAGEVVNDPYLVQLAADLPSGQYRLHVGWYLLATLRRLPVLDENGTAVDDKVIIPLTTQN